jgi:outer membrane protein
MRAAMAAAIGLAGQANAQSDGGLRVRAGLGGQTRPEFPGADKNEWAPLIDVSIARGDNLFEADAPDESFSPALISAGGFKAGPALAIEGSRKESEIDAPVGKVSTTIEAGAFVQYAITDSVRLRGELRQGIGGHKGLIGSVGADYIWRDGDRYVFTLGPRLLMSNGRYQRAYFGVTPEAALASGLPEYRPDGGVHGVAAASGMQMAVGGGFGLFGFARYERLVGDARRSPIVREFGSANQLSAGLGLNYTFRMRP